MKRAMAGLVGLILLAACSSGPESVTDGAYKFLAGPTIAGADGSTLTISGNELVLSSNGSETAVTITEGEDTYILCPPDSKGAPRPLSEAIEIGAMTFTSPAIFGDCGEISPSRVTIVDLDTLDESALPVFHSWAEFCDTSDPDC